MTAIRAGEGCWALVDVGQVLIGFDHTVIGARLVAECFPPEQRSEALALAIERFVLTTDSGASPNDLVNRGAKDIEWLSAQVSARFGVAIPPAVFESIWTSIFASQVNAEVIAMIAAWRTAGVQIGICSDTNASHWRFLRRRYVSLRRTVDAARCFLSFEMGAVKADLGFFERIAAFTNAPVSHHLLIDDRFEHCAAARSAGMHAVVFDPGDVTGSLRLATNTLLGGTANGE